MAPSGAAMTAIAPKPAPSVHPAHRGTPIAAATIGEAWIDCARLILDAATRSDWEGLPLNEIELVTLDVANPNPDDPLIAAHAPADWLAWMRANFTDHSRVAALGNA